MHDVIGVRIRHRGICVVVRVCTVTVLDDRYPGYRARAGRGAQHERPSALRQRSRIRHETHRNAGLHHSQHDQQAQHAMGVRAGRSGCGEQFVHVGDFTGKRLKRFEPLEVGVVVPECLRAHADTLLRDLLVDLCQEGVQHGGVRGRRIQHVECGDHRFHGR